MVQAYPSPCVKVVIRVSLCDEHQYILSTIIFVTISVLLEVRYYKCVTISVFTVDRNTVHVGTASSKQCDLYTI